MNDPQYQVEQNFLRWLGWFSNTYPSRKRIARVLRALPASAFEYEPHRRLYEAACAVLRAGRYPTVIALLTWARDDVTRLGGRDVLGLLQELPSGEIASELWRLEEEAKWLAERARLRAEAREAEAKLSALRQAEQQLVPVRPARTRRAAG